MRVAYLVNQYPGISHTFVRREIQALERRGVEVARFAIRPARDKVVAAEDEEEGRKTRHVLGRGAAPVLAEAAAEAARDPFRAIATLGRALRLGARSEAGLLRHSIYFAEALVVARWLRRERMTHLHAHFGTNSATVALLAARLARASFSMTVHGPEEFDKPGLLALPEKIAAARFVVGVSSFGVSQLRRLTAPAAWGKLRLVRCGVEPAFHAGAVSPPARAPVFVCVARLSPQKGLFTLVEAAAALRREGRDFAVRVLGDGEMRGDLERAIAAADVGDRVVLAGWKTPAEIRAEIERARIFLLPSYAEGLPVSIMEAFFLGRPVVSTYVAGIPELVREDENGWLAPAGDAAALADAMRAALDASDETVAAMGARGRARAAAMHDADAEAARLAACFAECAEAS